MPIAARYLSQDGRHSASGSYAGVEFEVVTGYDVGKDHFALHVYLGRGAERRRLPLVGAHAVSVEAALAAGLDVVKSEVDGSQGMGD